MNFQHILEQLDDVDLTILQAVRDGHDDTMKIREATTLDNRSINHHLVEKNGNLEEMELVDVHRPDGPERREVNGHTRYLPYAPKRVSLTKNGQAVVREVEEVESYATMTEEELVQRVRELEEQVENLEARFDVFRRQVRERLGE